MLGISEISNWWNESRDGWNQKAETVKEEESKRYNVQTIEATEERHEWIETSTNKTWT